MSILLSWHITILIYNWAVNFIPNKYPNSNNRPFGALFFRTLNWTSNKSPHLLTDGWGEGEAPIGISRDAGIVPGLWTVMGAGEAICGTGGGAAAIRGMVGCGKGCETSVKGTPVKQHTVDGQNPKANRLGCINNRIFTISTGAGFLPSICYSLQFTFVYINQLHRHVELYTTDMSDIMCVIES